MGNEANFKFEKFEKVDFDSLSSHSLTYFKKAVTFSTQTVLFPRRAELPTLVTHTCNKLSRAA